MRKPFLPPPYFMVVVESRLAHPEPLPQQGGVLVVVFFFSLKEPVSVWKFPQARCILCHFPADVRWAVFCGLCSSVPFCSYCGNVTSPYFITLMWEFISPSRWQKGGLVNLYLLEISH